MFHIAVNEVYIANGGRDCPVERAVCRVLRYREKLSVDVEIAILLNLSLSPV
ncbi:hypothetical protein D3C87_2056800 [compost metagenome]